MAGTIGAAPAVVAVAGRRIDAEGAEAPRFPLRQVPLVRQRIAALLAGEQAVALVCAAACGADLLALEAAARLGIRTRIVLPFGPAAFRRISVTDRPGDWGAVFDACLAAASAAGDLVVLEGQEGDDRAYAAANEAILDEAEALARPGWPRLAPPGRPRLAPPGRRRLAPPGRPRLAPPGRRRLALVVWEGAPRAGSDATAQFRGAAEARGFEGRSVLTL